MSTTTMTSRIGNSLILGTILLLHNEKIMSVRKLNEGVVASNAVILMTTEPGDLVFDPTCGSGTTAYVAEQWGRRWITCDTSRVAVSLGEAEAHDGVVRLLRIGASR